MNQRPSGYEPDELPDCSIRISVQITSQSKVLKLLLSLHSFKRLVAGAGFEPTTVRVMSPRATRLLHPNKMQIKLSQPKTCLSCLVESLRLKRIDW